MPYVDQVHRAVIDPMLSPILRYVYQANLLSGDVNYIVTRIILSWLGEKPCYADYNNAVGILECVKLELYRRMIAPYEDEKKEDNGDVYPDR